MGWSDKEEMISRNKNLTISTAYYQDWTGSSPGQYREGIADVLAEVFKEFILRKKKIAYFCIAINNGAIVSRGFGIRISACHPEYSGRVRVTQ